MAIAASHNTMINQTVPPPGTRSCAFQSVIDELRMVLNRSLKGKKDVIELVLACLLARGHLLLEDLPGLGKTTLAKALACAVGGRFARVQCTPDLLPSDITGFSLFNQKTREFEFSEGPVFSDVLLADEINRATPRTQSALFEAMAERQVSIDKNTYRLPPTFFVIATQNPVDSYGTYPLPEAQLDRFAVKLSIGYPSDEDEVELLAAGVGQISSHPTDLDAVVSPHTLADLQQHVAQLAVCEKVQRYLVALSKQSRQDRRIAMGISPRGLLTWQRLAQATAHLQGREFVTPDDVQTVAGPVLRLRLTGDFESPDPIIQELLNLIPVPTFD